MGKRLRLTPDSERRSPDDTAQCFLIREHYRGLGRELDWDAARVRRLCQALQLTEFEVGELLRVPRCLWSRCLSHGRFQATVELHLTLIERAVFPNFLKGPVFPPCQRRD